MEILIDPISQKKCPDLHLGILIFETEVKDAAPSFQKALDIAIQNIRSNTDQTDILHQIESTRKTYRLLGKDPSRYRPSAEALRRRILHGKKLYRINNIVDSINLISLQTGISIGGFDMDSIECPITCRVGKEVDDYIAIGRGKLNINNLPVLVDQVAAFGTPTSDSDRTKINVNTSKVLLVFYACALQVFTAKFEELVVKQLEINHNVQILHSTLTN